MTQQPSFRILKHGQDGYGRYVVEYEFQGAQAQALVTGRAEEAVNKGRNKDLILFQFVDPEGPTVRILSVEEDIPDIEKRGVKIDKSQMVRFS